MGEREERFARLFAAVYGPLVAYARRRVSPPDADDVVAEVLLIAWRRLEDVPAGPGALPWLYRVAYRTVGNLRRGERRRLRLVERLTAQPAEPPAHAGSDPAILEALAALRPVDQEVLRLAAWEGLTLAEIGGVLGCGPNAAAIRLSRARARLREKLKGSGGSRTHDPWKEIDV